MIILFSRLQDIKPQNLLLTGPLPLDEPNDPERTDELEQIRRDANCPSQDFVLKIADFGFARHLQTASLAETLCGSPLYMAPEILQHHRYDAKADLWSVGTVLFEMITGKPPFHGENHIDLLRNIQRKAVRLPPDVQVSRECVALLRLLLNRNPLSRAGFDAFFEANDAFVNLGCQGVATPVDEGTCHRPCFDLGTIPENDGGGTESMLTVATAAHQSNQQQQQQQQHQQQNAAPVVTPSLGPVPSPAIPIVPSTTLTTTATTASRPVVLAPLVPSPPTTSPSPIGNAVSDFQQSHPLDVRSHTFQGAWASQQQQQQAGDANREASSEENSFVMVEHGSSSQQKSPAASSGAVVPTYTGSFGDPYRYQSHGQPRLDQSPPPSPGYYLSNRTPVLTTRGDYMVVKQPKGMLSTSPGTGGAIMGMLSGRTRLIQEDANNSSKHLEARIKSATKMLAAAEDVGRRAISVANLGDQRAYAAMRLVFMSESASSSIVSVSPMEGIEEEDGAVTDDASSTEIMGRARRRRSSSATDKSMSDAKADDEVEEMPFAVDLPASPTFSVAGIPSRISTTMSKGNSITGSKQPVKPTPVTIRAHFSEALSCYLKALKMLKGAIAAAQGVSNELDVLSGSTMSTKQVEHTQRLGNRCESTTNWLSGQFKCVLERADATNGEISKPSSSSSSSSQTAQVTSLASQNATEPQQAHVSVEELIYNHALGYGREGAVKQLLGQFEPARTCYRTAGLLAETLLMESGMGGDDRKILEGYVDGFAARITELDEVMLQQSRQLVGIGGSSTVTAATASLGSSARRIVGGPSVVGLVGHPLAPPSLNHPLGSR